MWTVCGLRLRPVLGNHRLARFDVGGVGQHDLHHKAGLHGNGAHGDAVDAADDNAVTPLREVLLPDPPVEEADGGVRPQEHEVGIIGG